MDIVEEDEGDRKRVSVFFKIYENSPNLKKNLIYKFSK